MSISRTCGYCCGDGKIRYTSGRHTDRPKRAWRVCERCNGSGKEASEAAEQPVDIRSTEEYKIVERRIWATLSDHRVFHPTIQLNESNALRDIMAIIAECMYRAPKRESGADALKRIKNLVCGEMIPCWQDGFSTNMTRIKIADICDIALSKIEEAK